MANTLPKLGDMPAGKNRTGIWLLEYNKIADMWSVFDAFEFDDAIPAAWRNRAMLMIEKYAREGRAIRMEIRFASTSQRP